MFTLKHIGWLMLSGVLFLENAVAKYVYQIFIGVEKTNKYLFYRVIRHNISMIWLFIAWWTVCIFEKRTFYKWRLGIKKSIFWRLVIKHSRTMAWTWYKNSGISRRLEIHLPGHIFTPAIFSAESSAELTLRSHGSSGVRVKTFKHKIDYVAQVQGILNPEGFKNGSTAQSSEK